MTYNPLKSDPTNHSFIEIWAQILEQGIVLSFSEGQVLFYKDHFPAGVFVILSGKVELKKDMSLKPSQISQAPKNIPIGLDLIFQNQPYIYTAKAKTFSKVLFVNKTLLNQYFDLYDLQY